MSKTKLRKEFLEKRKAFATYNLSFDICKKAVSLPAFTEADTVMIYFASNFEVDTSYIIACAKSLGKTICAPRVLNDTDMEAAIIGEDGFCRGAFGIWEPKGPAISKVDLVFVPGVAFDKKGNRLGYGKGYYDRFLSKTSASTVGLAFSCQIAESLPCDEHDKRLDMILTEEGLYI